MFTLTRHDAPDHGLDRDGNPPGDHDGGGEDEN